MVKKGVGGSGRRARINTLRVGGDGGVAERGIDAGKITGSAVPDVSEPLAFSVLVISPAIY
ncbi:MAG: hypothetical protein ACYDDO_04795 [Acidiferrobacterales bacterium]